MRRMNPFERVEGFEPAYVDADTVRWIAALTPDGVLSLARRLSHSQQTQGQALKHAEIRGKAGMFAGPQSVTFRSQTDDGGFLYSGLTMHNVLSDWLAFYKAKNSDPRHDIEHESLDALAGAVEDVRKRFAQFGLLVYDVWGVDIESTQIYKAAGHPESYFPAGRTLSPRLS